MEQWHAWAPYAGCWLQLPPPVLPPSSDPLRLSLSPCGTSRVTEGVRPTLWRESCTSGKGQLCERDPYFLQGTNNTAGTSAQDFAAGPVESRMTSLGDTFLCLGASVRFSTEARINSSTISADSEPCI